MAWYWILAIAVGGAVLFALGIAAGIYWVGSAMFRNF